MNHYQQTPSWGSGSNKPLVLFLIIGVGFLSLATILIVGLLSGSCSKQYQSYQHIPFHAKFADLPISPKTDNSKKSDPKADTKSHNSPVSTSNLAKYSKTLSGASIWVDKKNSSEIKDQASFKLIVDEIKLKLGSGKVLDPQEKDLSQLTFSNEEQRLTFVFSKLDESITDGVFSDILSAHLQKNPEYAVGVLPLNNTSSPYHLLMVGTYANIEYYFDKIAEGRPGPNQNGKGYISPKNFVVYTLNKLDRRSTFLDAETQKKYSTLYNGQTIGTQKMVPEVFVQGQGFGKGKSTDENGVFAKYSEGVAKPSPEQEKSRALFQTVTNAARASNAHLAQSTDTPLAQSGALQLSLHPSSSALKIRQLFTYYPRRYVPHFNRLYTNGSSTNRIHLNRIDPCNKDSCQSSGSACEQVEVTGEYNVSTKFEHWLDPKNTSPGKQFKSWFESTSEQTTESSQDQASSPCLSSENLCAMGIKIDTSSLEQKILYQAQVLVYPPKEGSVEKMFVNTVPATSKQDPNFESINKFHIKLLQASVASTQEPVAEFNYFFKIED